MQFMWISIEKHHKVIMHFMQILKNIALFLFGIFLVVFGFRANTDKAGSRPAEQKESAAAENDSSEGDKNQKAPEPEKKMSGKASRAGKTRLEKKAPEKAGGSK